MENKILLAERVKGEKIKYYTSKFDETKSLVKEIVYNRLADLFSGDDQIGPELLKKEDIDGYINHTSMCYGNTGNVCKALSNLKEFVNDFLKCEEKEKLQYYINLFNEKVLEVAGINVLYEIHTNYENEFESHVDKLRFEYLLDNLVNNDEINEFTYMMWSYQSNYSIGMGGWNWSNSIENMKLFVKHKVLRFMLDVCDLNLKLEVDTENYGVNKLLSSLVKVSNEEQRKMLLNIEELMNDLDEDITFNTFGLIVDKISHNFEELNVKNDLYLFKGTQYSRMLIKEHGCKFDEKDLLKTFTEDIIC